MRRSGRALAYEAKLLLKTGIDARVPGAAVTTALCGHWEHDDTCVWPHHNDIQVGTSPPILRVILVAEEADQHEVVRRIEAALGEAADWSRRAAH